MTNKNLIISWSDANGDSIIAYKLKYSKDNGATWIENTPFSISPIPISPIIIPLDINALGFKSGIISLKVAIYDGTLWSDFSESVNFLVPSFVDSITKVSDIVDKSETVTFNVVSDLAQQQIRVTPSVNYIAGFKTELYKGLVKLQTLEWSIGNTQSKVFTFTPITDDEEYKIKVIPNLPISSGNNLITASLRLLNDTNNIDFAIVNIQRNNTLYNELINNNLQLIKGVDSDLLIAQFEVTSELTVELTNTKTSEVIPITFLINTEQTNLLVDINNCVISSVSPESDTTYTYSF